MNVLFIGPYRQTGEWGRKSRALLNALQKTPHNVTSRPLYMQNTLFLNHGEESEFTLFDSYDAVVQFSLPTLTVYDNQCGKNIGVFNNEMMNLPPDSLRRISMFDEIWVDSEDIRESIQCKLQDVKVRVIGAYLDPWLWKLSQGDDLSILRANTAVSDRFIFYTLGDITQKSGLREAVTAYYSTFNHTDHVILAIIVESPVEQAALEQLITSCKDSVGAVRDSNSMPNVTVFNPPTPSPMKVLKSLHVEADCFIMPSYSVNTSTLSLEAACFGNTPILNKGTASYGALGEENCWGIESYDEISTLDDRPFRDMFTSQEICRKPIIKSLSSLMREAYVNKFSRDKKKKNNLDLKRHLESDENYSSLGDILCS